MPRSIVTCLVYAVLMVLPPGASLAAAKPVVINEVMALNDAFAKDLHGEFDDWIEIYNAGSDPIDLAGMYLTDDLEDPTKWQFPTDNRIRTTVGPKGYTIVWAD